MAKKKIKIEEPEVKPEVIAEAIAEVIAKAKPEVKAVAVAPKEEVRLPYWKTRK